MQVGAAAVERAKSRGAYINASQKSDVYPTIRVVAYCSRVGSNVVPLKAEEFRYGMFGRVYKFLHQVHIFQAIFTKNDTLVAFPSYIQTFMFYQAPPHANLRSALTRKLAIRSHEK